MLNYKILKMILQSNENSIISLYPLGYKSSLNHWQIGST